MTAPAPTQAPSTALEVIRAEPGHALTREEVEWNHKVRLARVYAGGPLVPKAMKDKPEVVFVAFAVCEAYGADWRLAVKQVHYMNGDLVPSAQLQGGVMISRGYELSWDEEDGGHLGGDYATLAIRKPGRNWSTFTTTHAAAVRSGKFDEWVENWPQGQRKQVWKLRRDGQPFPHDTPAPAWVAKEVAAGNVKRFDGWWDYEEDMLASSATRKAARRYASDAMLGLHSLAGGGDTTVEAWVDPLDVPDDDEVFDGEIVDTDVPAAHSPGRGAPASAEQAESPAGSALATPLERQLLHRIIDPLPDEAKAELKRRRIAADIPPLGSDEFTSLHGEQLLELAGRVEIETRAKTEVVGEKEAPAAEDAGGPVEGPPATTYAKDEEPFQ